MTWKDIDKIMDRPKPAPQRFRPEIQNHPQKERSKSKSKARSNLRAMSTKDTNATNIPDDRGLEYGMSQCSHLQTTKDRWSYE